MPPIKVLHVLRNDHASHVGGDVVQLRETVEALRLAGVDATAATLRDAPEAVDIVQLYNVQLPADMIAAFLNARKRWPRARIVISPIFPHTSAAAMRSRDALTMRKAARATIGDAGRVLRLRRTIAAADAVLANSKGELAHVRRWFLVRDGGVALNGVAIDRWPFRPVPQDRSSTAARFGLDTDVATLVASVGRLEPLKNQLTLIRAIDLMPNTALVLIGPDGHPSYSATVRAAAARRAGRVAFAGRLTQPELAAVLAHVDVHVLPSFRESFGLVTLEAAACGCEVVVGQSTWTREWLGDGSAYADEASPASFAAAIRELRERPRHPRLRRMVERYDWSLTAQATAECYERVCSTPAGRADR